MSALACALVALAVGAGDGSKYMETVLQDDAVFLHRRPAEVEKAARQVAKLGADRLRLTAGWSELAPAARSKRIPSGFDPADPREYPQERFRSLDTAVKAADAAGLDVQVDLAFWAPRWAVRRAVPRSRRQRLYPSPERFAEFARAVARRYRGDFPDPDGDGDDKLPAVRLWTTWNEPNHPSFLAPQWVRGANGAYRPMAPHVYRAMHNAAYAAVKEVSGRNDVLMGGTASVGSSVPGKGGVPPLQFLRELACVDAALRPLRVPECAGFQPLKADGWAHHPYSRYTTPATSATNPDDVPIADLGRLSGLLEELRKRGRIASRLPLYQTEYGYESRQDDPFQPFTREDQASFIGWSTYLAWKDPDTRMMAQFLLRDIDPRESGRKPGTRSYYRDWQSGLFTAAGEAKPAAQAFKLPFWPEVSGEGDRRVVRLFGQVRPGRGEHIVRVERQDAGGAWLPVRTFGPNCDGQGGAAFLTDASGFFLRAAEFSGEGVYRLSWQRGEGIWEHGVPVGLHGPELGPPPAAVRASFPAQ